LPQDLMSLFEKQSITKKEKKLVYTCMHYR
jgi:hypothetical protein